MWDIAYPTYTPYKNMGRVFATNEFYHIFDRGVDKRKIFLDKNDHLRFIHDLYEFNNTKPAPEFVRRQGKNVGHRISHIESSKRELLVNLHAFVLMPNHHHELVEQLKEGGITLFIRKLHVGYAKAFNLKYERSGYLFQGRFKDVYIRDDRQLAHLICYIHSNPLEIWRPKWKEKKLTKAEIKEALKFLENYRWSSHLDYCGIKNFPSLINSRFLLEFFDGTKGYKEFFIDWLKQYETNTSSIQDLTLD